MNTIQQLHEKALQCAKDFLKLESELINILQELDDKKAFFHFGYTSLFQYAVSSLKLSEGQAYALISISRKSREVPELKEAISQGTLNSSQARRIVSVITPDNKNEWIAMSQTLSQRELEKKIVAERPKEAVRDKMTYLQPSQVKLVCGISEELMKEIERVKEIVSQNTGRPANLEETLKAMATLYLERKDPIKKAERVLEKKQLFSSPSLKREGPSFLSLRRVGNSQGKRTTIPAQIRHEVMKRDRGQCTFKDKVANPCQNKRWIDLHHKKPIADGGEHSLNNIITLCRQHHRFLHQRIF